MAKEGAVINDIKQDVCPRLLVVYKAKIGHLQGDIQGPVNVVISSGQPVSRLFGRKFR